MTQVDNIKIRQAWLDDEVGRVQKEGNFTVDSAFMYLGSSLILECLPEDIDPSDIVDGAFDKQVDLINIDDDQERGCATVSIIQAKNKASFESNIVIQIRNGLDWIFERPKADIDALGNLRFKNKILEIRELRSDYGASNIKLYVYHMTLGDTSNLSVEYLSEAKVLREKYSNAGFGDFKFSQIGAHELIEIIDEGDRHKRRVDLELPIIYDVNRPSVVQYSQGDTSSVICSVRGSDLAKIALTEPRDAIFDLNVRPFYGSTGKVNKEIWDTCTGGEAARFWFLNNGVTMVCDKFDLIPDPDTAKIKILNAQIVNGCQTTVTIREAHLKGELSDSVRVLMRIYATDNPTLVDKITLTTNNQNRITDRDLRANDPVQRDIERIMLEKYGFNYERKNRQHRALKGARRKKIVPSPKAAQAYLAIVRKKPSNARGYLSAVWSDFYSEIFENASVADLALSYIIMAFCQQKARDAKDDSLDDIDLETRVYGANHVARAVGFYLVSDKWGNSNLSTVEGMIADAELPTKLEMAYQHASAIARSTREVDRVSDPIPALYFKNAKSQKALNAMLSTIA